ncbi:acyltransferase family protein [Alkalinema pantanalense CENA528]|uniref:acyltransferase family protein n=1 Tax=Alkalinema pantanalense TaxID=1620705 RepID=UPI003D6ED90E
MHLPEVLDSSDQQKLYSVSQSSYDRFLSNRHFGSLDGIRCFCILAVLWHHSQPSNMPLLLTRGFLGVDLFFVLSGFLIVTLLLREKSKTGKISLRKFYVRRSLRTFPGYYGLLLCLGLVYGFWQSTSSGSASFFAALPWYVTYLSNWSLIQANGLGSMWSLAAEEQFYLIWPAIEKYCKRVWVYVSLGLMLVINQCINFGLFDPLFAKLYGQPEAPHLEILDSTFMPICLGIVLAHLLHRPQSFSLLFQGLGRRSAPLVFFSLLFILLYAAPSDISGWPRLLIQIVMTLGLGSLVVREDHCFKSVLSYKPIVHIGQISYGIYLYHLWIFSIVAAVLQAVQSRFLIPFLPPLFLVGSLVTIGVAELSYRFYETPFLQWKHKFSWQK